MDEEKKSFKIIYILILALTVTAFLGLHKYSEFNREHYLKPAKAKHEMMLIMSSLISYQKEFQAFPGTADYSNFLEFQPDPTYKTEIPVDDPWGSPYKYESPVPGDLPYRITSLGADKSPGGIGKDTDLVSDEILQKLLDDLKKNQKKTKH